MQQRRLGRTGHQSSVLIYGAAALAEVMGPDEQFRRLGATITAKDILPRILWLKEHAPGYSGSHDATYRLVEGGAGTVTVRLWEEGRRAMVSVSDDGPGIGAAIVTGVAEALGADWRTAIDPGLAARLRRRLPTVAVLDSGDELSADPAACAPACPRAFRP